MVEIGFLHDGILENKRMSMIENQIERNRRLAVDGSGRLSSSLCALDADRLTDRDKK